MSDLTRHQDTTTTIDLENFSINIGDFSQDEMLMSQRVKEFVDRRNRVKRISINYRLDCNFNQKDIIKRWYYFLNELVSKTAPLTLFPHLLSICFEGNGIIINDTYGAQLVLKFINQLVTPFSVRFDETRFSLEAIQYLCAGYPASMTTTTTTTAADHANGNTITPPFNNNVIAQGNDIPQFFRFSFNNCVWLDNPFVEISGSLDYRDYSDRAMNVTISKTQIDEMEATQLTQTLMALEKNNTKVILREIKFQRMSLSFEAYHYLQSHVHECKYSKLFNFIHKTPDIKYMECKFFIQDKQAQRMEQQEEVYQEDEKVDIENIIQQDGGFDNDNEDSKSNDNEEKAWDQNTISGSFTLHHKICKFVGFDMNTKPQAELLRPILENVIQSRQLQNLKLYEAGFSSEALELFLSPILVNNGDSSSDSRYMRVPLVEIIARRFLEDPINDDISTCLPPIEWFDCNGRTIKIYSCRYNKVRSNIALVKFLTECSLFKSVDTLNFHSRKVRNVDFLELSQIILQQEKNIASQRSVMNIKTLYMESSAFTDASTDHLAALLEERKNSTTTTTTPSILHVDIGRSCEVSIDGAWRLVEMLKVNHFVTMTYKSIADNGGGGNDHCKEFYGYPHYHNVLEQQQDPQTFQLLQENFVFYSTLNKIGHAQSLMRTDQLPSSIFAVVLQRANHCNSLLFWLLQKFSNILFAQQSVGQKRKVKSILKN